MIKLHHLNRSRSHRIFWLLEEIGIPYEVVHYERDPITNFAPSELLQVHPLGKSPMIEMDGKLVIESGAIVELLCQRHAPQMIPDATSDAYLRHLECMHFAEGSAMIPILLNLYVGKLKDAGAPLHPRINAELNSHFSYMEGMVRTSGHFVLDELSAADIMLSFPAEISGRLGYSDDFPKLTAFQDMIQSRPAYKRAMEKGNC
ncbi:glutathione S-transferase [Sulfitobacter sp. F26204]|uniref:glutathione S-transferase family protein n=1 Tax=Sulfitobacter sp. F26204 TaxID=2996014 RepID=UPI00225E56DF|nr:glutathione S-transferase [Sulfitobacter sp. F26204]MCX7560964.1 glutathione S-transferase [Sulfitobacter sp. F26204]